MTQSQCLLQGNTTQAPCIRRNLRFLLSVNKDVESGNAETKQHNTDSLFGAIQSEDINCVIMQLRRGGDWSIQNKVGKTPLGEAARAGFSLAVRSCLFDFTGLENRTERQYLAAEEALINACSAGHADIVQMLLLWGINANVVEESMDSMLTVAVRRRRTAVAQALLNHGVNVNATDQFGITPLQLAAFLGNVSMVRCLLSSSATDVNALSKYDRTALYYAAEKGNTSVVRELLRAGACRTLSESAVAKTKDIQELLRPLNASALAYVDSFQGRRLMWALTYKDIPTYLRNGAFFQSLDADDDSVLHVPFPCFRFYDQATNLCEFSIILQVTKFWMLDCIPDGVIEFCYHHPFAEWHKVACEYLSSHTLYRDLCAVFNGSPKNALSRAARLNKVEIVNFLAPHFVDEFTNSSMMTIVARQGNLKLLQVLHEHRFPWSKKVCAAAASGGHLECLKYAHENGCEWDEDTIIRAAMHGHFDCLRYAYEQNCISHPNVGQKAIQGGNMLCLQYVVEHTPYMSGVRACAQAAASGKVAHLKYLHEKGCVWSCFTTNAAARAGQIETLQYAIENGCPYAVSAAYLAACAGNLPCLRYLLVDLATYVLEREHIMAAAMMSGNCRCVALLYQLGYTLANYSFLSTELSKAQRKVIASVVFDSGFAKCMLFLKRSGMCNGDQYLVDFVRLHGLNVCKKLLHLCF